MSFLDPSTGLPKASVDLWEQHDGQHAYSAASVAGGLRCAALAAARHEPGLATRYAEAAARVAAAIDEHLWDATLGRYRRASTSVDVTVAARRPGPPSHEAFRIPTDASGASTPSTAESTARCSGSRGRSAASEASRSGQGDRRRRRRRSRDATGRAPAPRGRHVRGGHEWPIATLWLGLARRALGDQAGLDHAVAHVVGIRTALDLLPEQVFPDGRPAWVLPLGWSHAMLLVASQPELRTIQRLREEVTGDGRGG